MGISGGTTRLANKIGIKHIEILIGHDCVLHKSISVILLISNTSSHLYIHIVVCSMMLGGEHCFFLL